MSLDYNKRLIPRARNMRKPLTPQERRLWYGFLSGYPIRFQRQKTIGNYIVDFYCHQALLVIELDGAQHYEPQTIGYDLVRTEFLSAAGIEVLRIPNDNVTFNFAGVCILIDYAVKCRLNK